MGKQEEPTCVQSMRDWADLLNEYVETADVISEVAPGLSENGERVINLIITEMYAKVLQMTGSDLRIEDYYRLYKTIMKRLFLPAISTFASANEASKGITRALEQIIKRYHEELCCTLPVLRIFERRTSSPEIKSHVRLLLQRASRDCIKTVSGDGDLIRKIMLLSTAGGYLKWLESNGLEYLENAALPIAGVALPDDGETTEA